MFLNRNIYGLQIYCPYWNGFGLMLHPCDSDLYNIFLDCAIMRRNGFEQQLGIMKWNPFQTMSIQSFC